MDVVDLALTRTAPIARPGLLRRFTARLRRSLPPLATVLVGSACWALVMAASALLEVWRDGWQTEAKFATIAMLFGAWRRTRLSARADIGALRLARKIRRGDICRPFPRPVAGDHRRHRPDLRAGLPRSTTRPGTRRRSPSPGCSSWFSRPLGALIQFAVLGVRLFFPLGIHRAFPCQPVVCAPRALSIAAASVRTRAIFSICQD